MLPRPAARTVTPFTPAAPVTFRAWVLWGVVAGAIVVGVVLYFRYERALTPLVG